MEDQTAPLSLPSRHISAENLQIAHVSMATRTEVSLICPALASRSFLSIFTLCSCSLSRLCVIRLISYRHTFDFLSRHVMVMDECKHVHQRCLFPSACPIPGEPTQRHLTTNEKNPPVGLHENLLFCSLSE